MSSTDEKKNIESFALRGRKRIYTDADSINEKNIFNELQEAMIQHSQNVSEMQYLLNFEKGEQPLVREKTVRSDIDIKVVDNLANQITEFKLGYNWGYPITFVQRANSENPEKEREGIIQKAIKVIKGSDNKDEAVAKLNEMNDLEFSSSKDQSLARYVEICGIGYQMVDIKRNYEELSAFDLITLNPLFTFCIYKNNARQDKIAAVTFRRLKTGTTYYTVFTKDTRYEVQDLVKVVNGKKEDKWGFMSRSGETNPLGEIPIVEFHRSVDRTGCFERQISDMNALNVEVSDFANSVAQVTQEIWWGNDFEFEKDENGNYIAPISGQWLMTKSGQGTNPRIQALVSQFDFQGVQENIVSKRSLILQKCYVPLQSDPGGGSTGAAMSMSSGWSAAESAACKEEQTIRKGKMEISKLELIAIKKSGHFKESDPLMKLSLSDIKPQFTRNKTYDLITKVNAMVTMIKVGVYGRDAMETVDLFRDVAQTWSNSKQMIIRMQESLISDSSETGVTKSQADASDQITNSPIIDGMSTDGGSNV